MAALNRWERKAYSSGLMPEARNISRKVVGWTSADRQFRQRGAEQQKWEAGNVG